MKELSTIMIFIFKVYASLAQEDSIKLINEEYSQSIYNPITKSSNLSYNYSNKWDFDGDKKNDSLFFIGNGGAHTYFHPKVILSSDNLEKTFPNIEIDMPYLNSLEDLNKCGKNPGIQFVVNDFDNDGIQDIYLNFNNPFGSIPKTWKAKEVKSKYVLLSFRNGKLNIKDY